MNWQSMRAEDVLKELNVSKETGLREKEVLLRRETYGKNVLTGKKKKSLFRKFLEQFSDFMVLVLIAAAVVSFVTAFLEENGDFADPVIILGIVVLNAVIGVIQESRAEKAIEALRKMSSPESRVRRGGIVQKLPSEELVPGDILLLEAGDFVPADARLLSTSGMKVEESALTGESFPVEKDASLCVRANEAVADQRNMVFASSGVAAGNGVAVVVSTGMQSQVGKIAALLTSEEDAQTPLQVRLAKTGKVLGIAAMLICAGIFLLGMVQKAEPLEMFMIAVSLAVAAIPEGLPAVVTIVLAFGVRRMAQKKAIIRRLPAVETLGSASVICSDKTGTLTQNRMTVTELVDAEGTILQNSVQERLLMECAVLCNNAVAQCKNGRWNIEGEPTETALVQAAVARKVDPNRKREAFPRVAELPFDSTRKRMVTVHRAENGGYRIILKGAPEQVLPRCRAFLRGETEQPAGEDWMHWTTGQNERMASRALRVLAVAFREVSTLPKTEQEMESGLTFLGFCGMIDPPRPEVREAVRVCRRAGIRPVMITGDHAATAAAIAREIGLLQRGETVLSGSEIDRMDPTEFGRRIRKCAVFARVTPEHKVRIVRAFREQGEVVAMTGDGVNDAPALKAADIGCAMGKNGTDVAKGAADMILTDDNFATIVTAVGEGRGIYDNIRKAVHFLLSSNIGEILTVLSAFLLKLPAPLLAIQLLWVNLVTDSLPALALGVEPQESDLMQRKPIPAQSSLFSDGLWGEILLEGAMIGSLSLLAFVVGRTWFDGTGEPVVGRTMTFAVLSISQLVHAFNIRSRESLFRIGVASNRKMIVSFLVCLALEVAVITVPALAKVFGTTPLNAVQWGIVAGCSLVPLVAVELQKALNRRKNQ